MNKLKTKLKSAIMSFHTEQYGKTIKFVGKHIIVIFLIVCFVFTIGFATYRVILLELLVKTSNILYYKVSRNSPYMTEDNPNAFFTNQYLCMKLRENNVTLFNHTNPILWAIVMQRNKDNINIKKTFGERECFHCSYVELNTSPLSRNFILIPNRSKLIAVCFQKADETPSEFELLMSGTHGKLYGSEVGGYFNFIIIPNFYSKQEIQNEIDNFIKECIAKK